MQNSLSFFFQFFFFLRQPSPPHTPHGGMRWGQHLLWPVITACCNLVEPVMVCSAPSNHYHSDSSPLTIPPLATFPLWQHPQTLPNPESSHSDSSHLPQGNCLGMEPVFCNAFLPPHFTLLRHMSIPYKVYVFMAENYSPPLERVNKGEKSDKVPWVETIFGIGANAENLLKYCS